MKNIIKKLSVVLMVAMIISVLPMGNVAQAAKKYSYKKTLYVGDKHPLQYTYNFKKIKPKKVKWSSSNKKVATISKKGVITAKKKGTAIITAKYKKDVQRAKITVKRKKKTAQVVQTVPTAAPVVVQTPPPVIVPATPTPIPNNVLAQNIVPKVEKLPSGDILYTVTNNNTIQVSSVKLSVMYFDAAGMPVKTDDEYFDDVVVGGSLNAVADVYSSDLEKIDLTKTQVSVSVTNYTSITNYVTESVKMEGTVGEENKLFLTYTNPTAQKVWVSGTIFYRDANKNVLAARDFIESVDAGATTFEDYIAPYYKEAVEGLHTTSDKIPFVTADWVYRAYYY